MIETTLSLLFFGLILTLQIFVAVAQAFVTKADVHGDVDDGDAGTEATSSKWYGRLRNYCYPLNKAGKRHPRRALIVGLIVATPIATIVLYLGTLLQDHFDDEKVEARHILAMNDASNKHKAVMDETQKNHNDVLKNLGAVNDRTLLKIEQVHAKEIEDIKSGNEGLSIKVTSLEQITAGSSEVIAELRKVIDGQNAQLVALGVSVEKVKPPQVVIVPQQAPEVVIPSGATTRRARPRAVASYRFDGSLSVAPVPNQVVKQYLMVGVGNEGICLQAPTNCHWEPEQIKNGWAAIVDSDPEANPTVNVLWPVDVNPALRFRGKGTPKLKFGGVDSTSHSVRYPDEAGKIVQVALPARTR